MSRPALLDSSYLIDLERETAVGKVGPARTFLSSLRGRPLVISIVSVEELWRALSTKRQLLQRCSGLPFKDCTSHRRDGAPGSSVVRRNALARTTRGSSPPPNDLMQTSSAQTVQRSGGWARATCAFVSLKQHGLRSEP